MMQRVREREELEKKGVIEILRTQIEVEVEAQSLLEETSKEIESTAVNALLRMIALDSMKHVGILQLIIDILQGEDILVEEKGEIMKGLRRHIEVERDSMDRSKKLFKNVWISQNEGLKELVKIWRNDEREHHKILNKLSKKMFFRVTSDFGNLVKTSEMLEERYTKYERKKR